MLIHTASVAAGGVGAGLAQVPLADIPVLMALQIPMVIEIAKLNGAKVTEASAGALIMTIATRSLGVAISRQLVGWIPGIGNAIKAATAAGMTEALGWAANAYFQKKEGAK